MPRQTQVREQQGVSVRKRNSVALLKVGRERRATRDGRAILMRYPTVLRWYGVLMRTGVSRPSCFPRGSGSAVVHTLCRSKGRSHQCSRTCVVVASKCPERVYQAQASLNAKGNANIMRLKSAPPNPKPTHLHPLTPHPPPPPQDQ